MTQHGYAIAAARRGPGIEEVPFLDFTSGYVQRARDVLPKQGSAKPWKLHQNYALDMASLKYGAIEDGVIEFSRCQRRERVREPA
jgi:hypothetical protein